MRNALGVPLKVHACRNLQVVGLAAKEDIHEIAIDQNLEFEYSTVDTPHRGKLSAMYRLESSLFTLSIGKM